MTRAEAERLVEEARAALQPTSRFGWRGVTRRQIDLAADRLVASLGTEVPASEPTVAATTAAEVAPSGREDVGAGALEARAKVLTAEAAYRRDLVLAQAEAESAQFNKARNELHDVLLPAGRLDAARKLVDRLEARLTVDQPRTSVSEGVLALADAGLLPGLPAYRRSWPHRHGRHVGDVWFRAHPDPGHDGLDLWCSLTWGPWRWTHVQRLGPGEFLRVVHRKDGPEDWPLLVEVDPDARVEFGTGDPPPQPHEIVLAAAPGQWRQWARTSAPDAAEAQRPADRR